MYGYGEYIEITPEQILQKVTQQDIFEFALQEPFDFAARYISPCRDDKKPGCRFEEREDGTIVFVDFGERLITGRTHRTCFGLVMDKFGISLQAAITMIMQEFKLSSDLTQYEQVNKVIYQKREFVPTITDIRYLAQPYSKIHKLHWSQFLISTEQLLSDNVHCCKKVFIKKGARTSSFQIYKHGYAIDFLDAVKIYQPYSETYKWISNCTEDHIGNIDNLPKNGKELIIQKSYKDHRVLRNLDLGFNVIWFQNEGCTPRMEILVNLVERFEYITIFYDNDETGIKAAKKLMEIFNSIKPGCCRMIYLPQRKFQWKDPAKFISMEGRADLIKVLKYIGLHGSNT